MKNRLESKKGHSRVSDGLRTGVMDAVKHYLRKQPDRKARLLRSDPPEIVAQRLTERLRG